MKKTWQERFWAKVDRSGGPDACWIWTGGRKGRGYGEFYKDHRLLGAHRVAWELAIGPIPNGLDCLHSCDNPPCCNPAHLFLGTQADNNADMVAKGRDARGDKNGSRLHPERLVRGDMHFSRACPERLARGQRHGSHTHPERLVRGNQHWTKQHPESIAYGERQGSAKLTADKVAAIRDAYAVGGVSQQELADRYHVSQTNIGMVIRRKTWASV